MEWKTIPGYEGVYEVSDCGQVRNSHFRTMSQHRHSKGYLCVGLTKDGVFKSVKVHRLVAMAFIPNPFNLPCVNHKDEDKTNNHVDNLEWCTALYNTNYGSGKYRAAKTHWVAVIGTDKDGNEIRFDSFKDAAEKVNGNPQCISQCCRKIQGKKTAYGWKWRYEDKEKNNYYSAQAERNRKTHNKPVIATDKYGNEYRFLSIKEGTTKTGAHKTSIIGCCRGKYGCHTAAGYKWRYANK